MTVPQIKFNREVSLGNILLFIGMVASFGMAYTNFISTVKDQQAQIETNRIGLAEVRLNADARSAKYVPIIEAQERANEVQDTRFQNLVVSLNSTREAIAEQGKSVAELAKIVGQTHEDMAVLKVQLQRQADGSDRR